MRRHGAKKEQIAASGLVPKTIRFHTTVWTEIEARAGHIAPAEWLRAEIYEKVLGLNSPQAVRERAA